MPPLRRHATGARQIRSTGQIWFKPDNARFFTLNTSNVDVRANICLDCGTIDLVGDAQKAQSLIGTAKAE